MNPNSKGIGASNKSNLMGGGYVGLLGEGDGALDVDHGSDSLVSDLANATICALPPVPAAITHCTEIMPLRSTSNAILPRERMSCATPQTVEVPRSRSAAAGP